MTLPDITLTSSSGETYNLSDYNGQILLIVNTATDCGLASQFDELEKIWQTYQNQELKVLGFPSNSFKQETTSDADMAATCRANHGVTFPLHKTAEVNGDEQQAIFKWLKEAKAGLFNKDIKWNFTKFLVNRNGEVVERYAPTTNPKDINKDIQSII